MVLKTKHHNAILMEDCKHGGDECIYFQAETIRNMLIFSPCDQSKLVAAMVRD